MKPYITRVDLFTVGSLDHLEKYKSTISLIICFTVNLTSEHETTWERANHDSSATGFSHEIGKPFNEDNTLEGKDEVKFHINSKESEFF